jgi:hypothetical protein
MSLGEVAELAADYSTQVRSMKRPAKEEINALTMVAADYVESPSFALAVVQVLERSVAEVSHTRSPSLCFRPVLARVGVMQCSLWRLHVFERVGFL